jgi:two-component system NtrC family response regulator
VKSALILAEGVMITPEDLGLQQAEGLETLFNLKAVRARVERQAVLQAISIVDGNLSRAADLLGISRPTLYDLMEKYAIRDVK